MKIVILLHTLCGVREEDVRELLKDTGIEFGEVVCVADSDELADAVTKGATVVIVLDGNVADEQSIETAARDCSTTGSSVIVVFGEGYSYSGMHPIADKYGNQSTWLASDLRDKIQDPEGSAPTDPSGSNPTRSSAKQVDCN